MRDVWLLQCLDEPRFHLLRIAAPTGGVVASIDLVDPPPLAGDSAQLAVGAGAVWVAAGHALLYRVDSAHNRVIAAVSVGHHLDGLAVTEDAVWLSNDRRGGRLIRIDADDNRIDLAIRFHAHALAVGAGSLWATWKRTITRLDEQSLTVQATFELDGFVSQHAFGLGALWAVTLDDDTAGSDHERSTVWRIDPATNSRIQIVELDGRPSLVVGAGAVWLHRVDTNDRAYLCRLDVESHELTRFESAYLRPCFACDDEVWGLDFDNNLQGGALVCFRPSVGHANFIGDMRGHAIGAALQRRA
jgi:hypothetical protein